MTYADNFWAGANPKINYDGIIVDLNNKADRDFTNAVFSASFKSQVTALSQLTGNTETLSFLESGNVFKAPKAGQLLVSATVPDMLEDGKITLTNSANGNKAIAQGTAGNEIVASIEVAMNQQISITYNMPVEVMSFKFIYTGE